MMAYTDIQKVLEERILDVTKRYSDCGYFPTASVRVFDREQTLAKVQLGQATEESVFDCASLTKIATTTQILMLIDQGRLSLDTNICDCFEELRQDEEMSARLAGITIFHLLTHTSTIADWYPFYTHRGEEFFQVLKTMLRETPRVSGVVYSDVNFILLGKLIEQMEQKPLDVCLQEDLVIPLHLGTMLYRPDHSLDVIPSDYGNRNEIRMCQERGNTFHDFRPLDQPVQYGTHDGNAHYYFDDVAGHAGIFANPQAYEKLCQFYMTTDKPVFMQAQQEQAPGRGLGLQVGAMYPYGCGHTGFTGTSIWFSREKNIGAVAFTNRLFYKDRLNDHITNDFRRALHETVLTAMELCK